MTTTNLAAPIKAKIVADLQSIATNSTTPLTLASVVQADLSMNVFDIDIPSFPCALVGMSSVTSDFESSAENIRVYEYPIMVVQQRDNILTPHDMEDLRDQIMNVFDTDYTLGGAANGAILPSYSQAMTISTADKTYVIFVVTIKAKQLYELGS